MKSGMKWRTGAIGVAAVSAWSLMAVPASASTITLADIVACGSSPCVVGDATVTAVGGDFGFQTLNGWSGYGVESPGNSVQGEIDGFNEAIEIAFASPSTLSAVQLLFLYQPPAFGDVEHGPDPDETAAIEAFFQGSSLGIVLVNVTGSTTATTTGGSISNLSIADETGGGAWLLSSPFGSQLIDSVRFFSGDPGPDATFSDFALGTTTYAPIPEPASLLLVGTGLGWLARRSRRQRRG